MKKVFIYFFAMVLIQVVCGLAVSGIWQLVTGSVDMTTMELIVASSTASVITIALFTLMKWTPFSRRFMQSRPWPLLFWCAVIGFGMLLPAQFIEEAIPEDLTTDILADQFKMLFSNNWGYLAVGLLAPFAEELVFRGAIQGAAIGYFEKRLSPTLAISADDNGIVLKKNMAHWMGIVLTALLFAVIHGNPAQMPHAFLVGLLLGWMCYRSGSIVPGIVVHWVNNTTAYVLSAMYPQTYDMRLEEVFGHSTMRISLAILFSLMIFAAGMFQYHIRTGQTKKWKSEKTK